MGIDLLIFDADAEDVWFVMEDAVVIPRVGEEIDLDNVEVKHPVHGGLVKRLQVRVENVRYYWDHDRIAAARVRVSMIA